MGVVSQGGGLGGYWGLKKSGRKTGGGKCNCKNFANKGNRGGESVGVV